MEAESVRIKWVNVFVFFLAALAVGLAVLHPQPLAGAIGSIRHIGADLTVEDRVYGLCVLGVILTTIVALAKVLTRDRGKDS